MTIICFGELLLRLTAPVRELLMQTPRLDLRASDIVYDRAGSSFATAPADAFDWSAILDGAAMLHLSGITPALGPATTAAAIRAAETTVAMAVPR